MDGVDSKIISLIFGIGFIYVLCRSSVRLHCSSFTDVPWREDKLCSLAIFLVFSDCKHDLQFKNILVWFVCWFNLVSGLSNHFWMLSHFAYIIATFAVANQILPIRITRRNPFGHSSSAYKPVLERSVLKACAGECCSLGELENCFISITCKRICNNNMSH